MPHYFYTGAMDRGTGVFTAQEAGIYRDKTVAVLVNSKGVYTCLLCYRFTFNAAHYCGNSAASCYAYVYLRVDGSVSDD